jgi:hypothetical protein
MRRSIWLQRRRKRKRRLWKRYRTSGKPQFSTTRTLCKRMSTSTCNMYVFSYIRSRLRRMSYTIREDTGKEKSEQSKCLVDFVKIKG